MSERLGIIYRYAFAACQLFRALLRILSGMNTGEDVQGLRKIIDFTRLLSIFILAIHFYIACYQAFAVWEWTVGITDKIVSNIARTGLFDGLLRAKLAALLLLVVFLIGVKGAKDEKMMLKPILVYLGFGALLYFAAALCFFLFSLLPSSKSLISEAQRKSNIINLSNSYGQKKNAIHLTPAVRHRSAYGMILMRFVLT